MHAAGGRALETIANNVEEALMIKRQVTNHQYRPLFIRAPCSDGREPLETAQPDRVHTQQRRCRDLPLHFGEDSLHGEYRRPNIPAQHFPRQPQSVVRAAGIGSLSSLC